MWFTKEIQEYRLLYTPKRGAFIHEFMIYWSNGNWNCEIHITHSNVIQTLANKHQIKRFTSRAIEFPIVNQLWDVFFNKGHEAKMKVWLFYCCISRTDWISGHWLFPTLELLNLIMGNVFKLITKFDLHSNFIVPPSALILGHSILWSWKSTAFSFLWVSLEH